MSEETPHIVFHLVSSTVNKLGDNSSTYRVVLDGASSGVPQVDEEIIENFRAGQRFYTRGMEVEMQRALVRDHNELERKVKNLEASYREALEENRKMKLALSVLQRDLGG